MLNMSARQIADVDMAVRLSSAEAAVRDVVDGGPLSLGTEEISRRAASAVDAFQSMGLTTEGALELLSIWSAVIPGAEWKPFIDAFSEFFQLCRDQGREEPEILHRFVAVVRQRTEM
jgi:hypothetical protein